MDLRSLGYFVATVEEGSISAASLRCHVAQPSITMAISKLEAELECKLLTRHRRGCEPTPAGRKLYEQGEALLQHAESIKTHFVPKARQTKLSLSISRSVRADTVEDMLRTAMLGNRELQIELVGEEHAADLKLGSRARCSADESFFPLYDERYALLIPKDNVLAYQQGLRLSELAGQPLVERIHCENQHLFEQVSEAYGLSFNIVAKAESEEWAHAMVAAGLGLCFAPLPEAYCHPRFVVRELNELTGIDTPTRTIGLMCKSDHRSQLEALWPSLFSP